MTNLEFVFYWWFILFLVGVIFLPITILNFHNFFDRGYIFSKILGVLFISYGVWLLASLKILPFTQTGIIFILIFLFLLNAILILRVSPSQRWNLLKTSWKVFILEEFMFFATLFFWSYVRAYEPSIHGLEKYMDFGFVNSILRADYFPPKDMWYAPLTINYYYFGHLATAVLTKLSGIDPAVTYNLMIATLFAFTFTGAFSIGLNLYRGISANQRLRSALLCGLLAGFLVALAGNLHTIYALNSLFNLSPYWYPNATRFIPLTIHEFPIYSFVVSDLHGHVLGIPIVLAIIALSLNILLSQSLNILKIFLLSFLIAVAYMTNAWDGLIYAPLTAVVFFYLAYRSKKYQLYTTFGRKQAPLIRYTLIIVGSIIFSLPFSLFFKPFVAGIGVLCAPEFLINIGKLGPFLFEVNHCQRSPLWQLLILHGFWYFWVFSFVFFLFKLNAKRYLLNAIDIFVLILIGLSTVLILLPEFFYAKDIYPAHYRANTMFKLGYQAFIMFGISTAYIMVRIFNFQLSIFKNIYLKLGYWVIGIVGLFLIGIYSFLAINSYYGNLKVYKGLDGLAYLKDLYPTDYEAILWIRKNIKAQPTILEANGDSYTDYARISANTGLPTVIGWPVHEWLWRGGYDVVSPRIEDVKTIYETVDLALTQKLLEKYNIKLIFVGDLEHQKYQNLDEEKFRKLGKVLFQKGETSVYHVGN